MCVPLVHTAPQLSVSLQGLAHLRLGSRGPVASDAHTSRAAAGVFVGSIGPPGVGLVLGMVGLTGDPGSRAVECLGNMLHLLDPTGSIFDFNF